MKKLWKKAVKNITFGLGTALDATGTKKLPENEEISKRVEKLLFYESHVKDLQKIIAGFSASITHLGNCQKDISTHYVGLFEDQKGRELSGATQFDTIANISQNVTRNGGEKIQDINYDLSDIIKEINFLKSVLEKRKKNLILMEYNEEKITSLEEKNQPIPEELSQTKNKREIKYNEACAIFISRFDSLDARVMKEYNNVFIKTKTIYIETLAAMKSNFTDDLDSIATEFEEEYGFPPI